MRYNFPVWNHISEIGGIIDEKNGTLDSLIRQYIYSADGSGATPVEFAHFDGAKNMMVSDLPLKSWVALALESMMVEDNLRSSEATVIGDLPDGMIATDSYFSDPNAIVSLKQE